MIWIFKKDGENMIMNLKRAQAALEFLTTYGWAFLVILIMIGTLAYFGILNPSKVLPGRCTFGAEFQCLDYQIAATGAAPNPQVKIRLKNNVGEAIDVSAMVLSVESTTALTCTPPANPTSWKSGELKDLAWTACDPFGGLISGEKGKILVTITYNTISSGSSYSRQVKGEVYAGVI